MNRNNYYPKHPSRDGYESIVYEYFRLIKNKDIDGVLNLFTNDAIVYEPFSNIDEGLKGKGSIRPFLDVVIMVTNGIKDEIEFEKAQDANKEEEQTVAALVTFERGGKTQARYTFELISRQEQYDYTGVGKIQTLRIEFIK